MTEENLKIANDLIPKIKALNDAINRWKCVYKLGENLNAHFHGNNNYSSLPALHIPLDILKVIVLDKYEKELRDLELQFQKL